jgi:uncharacterized membrane protein YhhN
MYWLILVVLSAAVLDWAAIRFRWQHAKGITKPLVMVLLIAWLYGMTGFHGMGWLFMLALVFSLIGDVWLMLPAGYFLFGLAAFFIAHCVYIWAFTSSLHISPLLIFVLLLAVSLVCVVYISQIRVGINRTRGARRLRFMAAAYCLILTIMMVAAISTTDNPTWLIQNSAQVAAGGMLFFLSDTMLAYDRFVKPIPNGRLWVRISYHLGQILIISGAALQLALV